MNFPYQNDLQTTKLLRSIQCAFPIQHDPWQDLATGIHCERQQLLERMDKLFAENILLGISLEADVAHPAFQEWIVPAREGQAEGIFTRWALQPREKNDAELSFRSVAHLKAQGSAPEYLEYAWPAVQWLKVGTFFDPSPASADAQREEMTERSFFVQPKAYEKLQPFDSDQAAILQALNAPFVPDTSEPFWKSVGQHINIPTLNVAREEVSRVLLSKRVRRFRAAVNPKALGYTASALVAWQLDDTSAPQAGAALAKLRASADVCLRKPTQKFPFTLSAILFGFDDADLQATILFIESKWNRKIDFLKKVSYRVAE